MGIARSTYYDRPEIGVDDTAIVEAIAAICDEFEAYGLIDWQAEHRAARSDLVSVGLSLDPRADLETLSAHERQLVAVARALKRGLKVLVPRRSHGVTVGAGGAHPSRSHPEAAAGGVSIIYVSHRLEEIFRIADRVTVLRDGKAVATLDVDGLTQKELARHIVGHDVGDLFERRTVTVAQSAEPRLVVDRLSDERLRGVSFSLNKGEVLGVCGCRIRPHPAAAHDLRACAAQLRIDHDRRQAMRIPRARGCTGRGRDDGHGGPDQGWLRGKPAGSGKT